MNALLGKYWPVCVWMAAYLLLAGYGGHVFQERVRGTHSIEDRIEGGDPAVREEARKRITWVNADSLYWLSYARDILRDGGWRIRETQADNAPLGRELHWSHGIIWMLAILAKIQMLIGVEDLHQALEFGALLLNPLILFLGVGLVGWILFRWMGLAPALVFLLALSGYSNILQTYHPMRPDHHGLQAFLIALAAICWARSGLGRIDASPALPPEDAEFSKGRRRDRAVRASAKMKTHRLAGILGLATGQRVLSLNPWCRLPAFPNAKEARFWAMAAGVCCGWSFWIGAVVSLPLFWGLWVAGFIAQWVSLKTGKSAGNPSSAMEASVWRYFGRATAATSFLMYLLEYFPGHLGVPLEVNHPVYALMALAAGEWGARWTARRGVTAHRLWPVLCGLGLVAVFPVALVIWGDASLWRIKEPLHVRWLELTTELYSWPMAYPHNGVELAAKHLGPCLLALVVAIALMIFSGRRRIYFGILAAPAFLALGYLILTWLQIRWAASFSIISWLMVSLMLGLLLAIPGLKSRGMGALFALILLGWWCSELAYVAEFNRKTADGESYSVLLRKYTLEKHLALSLSHRLHHADSRVLSHFGLAPALRYYADLPVVGSMYWENLEGMRYSAEVLASTSDARAGELLRRRGITHLVVATGDGELMMNDHLLNGPWVAQKRRDRKELLLGRLATGENIPFLTRDPWMPGLETEEYRLDGKVMERSPVVIRRVVSP